MNALIASVNNECASVTEKLAGALDAIVYKSSGIDNSRVPSVWRCESLSGGCPVSSTRYEQTLSDSSVHVGMVGLPRVEGFITAGLTLNRVRVYGQSLWPSHLPRCPSSLSAVCSQVTTKTTDRLKRCPSITCKVPKAWISDGECASARFQRPSVHFT